MREDRVYNRETGEYESRGWIVTQNLTVTLRDIEKVSSVLDVGAKNGVTNIDGPNFKIDDPSKLADLARERAIAKATTRADELATLLDVNLDEVIGYSEWTNEGGDFPRYAEAYALDSGLGGAPAPSISPGSEEGTLYVQLRFRLK